MADEGSGDFPWNELTPEQIVELSALTETDAAFKLGWRAEQAGQPEEAIRWYRFAAERGDVPAMYNLAGRSWEVGDRLGAETWFARAGDAGDPDGYLEVGRLAWNRDDVVAARRFYERAVVAGQIEAHVDLARLILLDDPYRAADLGEIAASLGSARGFGVRGMVVSGPIGQPASARAWLSAGVAQGDGWARYRLGCFLMFRDLPAALDLLRGPDEDYQAEAAEALASRRMAIARAWWPIRTRMRSALRWADPPPVAPVTVTTVTEEDLDPVQAAFVRAVRSDWSDRPNALAGYRQAADRGHPAATRRLGQLLVNSDPKQARRLTNEAIRLGDPFARWWRTACRQRRIACVLGAAIKLTYVLGPDLRVYSVAILRHNGEPRRWEVKVQSVNNSAHAFRRRQPTYEAGRVGSTTCPTRRAAREELGRIVASIADGDWVPPVG